MQKDYERQKWHTENMISGSNPGLECRLIPLTSDHMEGLISILTGVLSTLHSQVLNFQIIQSQFFANSDAQMDTPNWFSVGDALMLKKFHLINMFS